MDAKLRSRAIQTAVEGHGPPSRASDFAVTTIVDVSYGQCAVFDTQDSASYKAVQSGGLKHFLFSIIYGIIHPID